MTLNSNINDLVKLGNNFKKKLEIKEMLENFAWKLVLFRYFLQLIPSP